MQMQMYDILYLFTNFVNLVSIYRFMGAFFSKRRWSLPVCAAAYLLYFAATGGTYLLLDLPLITHCIGLMSLLMIAGCYQNTWQRYLASVCFTQVFIVIPEILVGALTGYFPYALLQADHYSNLIGLLCMRLLTYLSARIIFHVSTMKRNQDIGKTDWLETIALHVLTLILEAIIVVSEPVRQEKMIVSVILILFLNAFIFYLYDSLSKNQLRRTENQLLQRESELYSKQCEMMQSAAKELQTFRHDMRNQLMVIQQLLTNHQTEDVLEILTSLAGKLETSTLYSTTGNIAVDAIINYKLQSARFEGIHITTEIAVPTDLHLDVSDMTVLLGNLIDNALEALQSVAEKTFDLKVMYSQNRLLIRAVNPYTRPVTYENGKIISSKQEREHHGFGLKSIEAIVEKYDGYMNINHEQSIFTVDILMYVQKANS